jgi:hypothetical protein
MQGRLRRAYESAFCRDGKREIAKIYFATVIPRNRPDSVVPFDPLLAPAGRSTRTRAGFRDVTGSPSGTTIRSSAAARAIASS